MGLQSRAQVWVLSLMNEVFWSVGSSSVPPQTTTVEKLITKFLLRTSEQMKSSTASSEADCNFTCLNQSLLGVGKMKRTIRKKPYLLHIVHCPGSSRTGLVFAVVRRGHVQDTEVILHHLQGVGGRGSLLETKGPSTVQQKEWLDMVNCQGVSPWELLISCTLCHQYCCC